MKHLAVIAALASSLALAGLPSTVEAENTKLKEATGEVESGAKKIGRGIEDTAKGVGNTVVEGAKTAGDKLKEAGKAAEPEAKSAWGQVRDGAVSFGRSVKSFFTTLVGK